MKGFGKDSKPKKNLTRNIHKIPSKEQIINHAAQFHAKGNISKASEYYKYFIKQGFKDERVFSNYGSILKSLGKLKEAESLFRNAIELNPDFAMAHCNLGNLLSDFGKLKEAESFYKNAIELNPSFAEAHCNLGNLYQDLRKLKDSELQYHKAIEINRDYADAYFNLALVELLQGDYESGLEHYEFREKREKGLSIPFKPNIQKADNRKLEEGEKLLVVSEQGLGDTLQFMRYISYLRDQGLKISFCAQTKLHTLIQFSGIDKNPLKPEDATKISEGKWIPLLSLQRYLKVSPDNPIISEPYIFSTNALKKKWEKILSSEKRPIIGINWQGNPDVEIGNLKGRSLPLETFSVIARNNDFNFLSLQKGFGSEQLNSCSFKNKFIQCQSQIDCTWDFLENAAIIENCDLIITSDTSIAHLAGGMGKQTWLLLHHSSDWRWGLEEQNTFWYPSMKLFRQKENYDWQEVMERVAIALKKELTKND